MPATRAVKPEFFTDTKMRKMDPLTRLVYICLWVLADEEGKLEGDAETIQSYGFPNETVDAIDRSIRSLNASGRIRLFTIDSNPYITVLRLKIHQPKAGQTIGSGSSAFKEAAKEVLNYLNSRASKNFRAADANLNLIENVLASGASIDDCKSVIDKKCREWKGNPQMDMYLRPMTLFNMGKFEQYLGEINETFKKDAIKRRSAMDRIQSIGEIMGEYAQKQAQKPQ